MIAAGRYALACAAVVLLSSEAEAGLLACPEGTRAERSTYEKLFVRWWCRLPEGKRHGPYRSFIIIEERLHLNESGVFHHGHQHGTQRRYRRGVLAGVTDYRHGERHGRWERYAANGAPLEIGTYVDDHPAGIWIEWTYYWPEVAAKSESHRLVRRVPRYPGSDWWDVERTLHGAQRQWHRDGRLAYEGHYVDGERHGTHRGYRPDGALAWRDDYVYGRRHGRSERYWKVGAQWSAYRDDVLHGSWQTWHGGRVTERGEYEDGRRQGEWIVPRDAWHTEVIHYVSGREVANVACPDGTLASEQDQIGRHERSCLLADGRRHGPYVAWGPDGRIVERGTYVRGGRQGRWQITGMAPQRWVNDALVRQ